MHKSIVIIKVCFFFFISFSVMSQTEQDQTEHSKTDKEFERFKELFTIYPNKKAVAKDSTLYKSKLIMAPIITYSPETSLGAGIGAKYLFKFKGSGDETRTSNMPLSVQYTLKNQFILFSGFEIFTNQEQWVVTGNILFKNFPRLYYGFGRDSLEENEEQYDYNQFLFEPIFLKKMFTEYLFVGGGLRYNHIYNVGFEENGRLANLAPSGYKGSTSAGLELAILYDSRDNILNAKHGLYMEFTHGFYDKILGGTQKFELTRFDARYFFKPFKKLTDVVGLHAMGSFSHDDVPFSELALFGSQEILRGYIEGRYIDRHIMATQVEYRKNLKGRIGMVAFAGVGDIANKLDGFKLSNIRASFGLGLRFMLDREEDLNVRFDWGFGDKTNNAYLNIAEAF